MEELDKIFEMMTADLMTLDHEDLPGLAKLHDQFEEVIQAINDESDNISRVAQKCADLIEKIVLNEVPDRQVSFAAVTDAITGLQQIVRGEIDFAEVAFSEEVSIIANVDPIMSPQGGTASFGEFLDAGGT